MLAPDLRFPLGEFHFDGDTAPARRAQRIAAIAATPGAVRAAVGGLDEVQLDTPYRAGGWTVRQVVHHLPDSHLNAYTRFKLTLTEAEPVIRPYFEDRWAETAEARTAAPNVSLRLLDALHERWVILLQSIGSEQFTRRLFHPERNATMSLDELLALYAWHGPHHIAQITALRERMDWNRTD